MATVALTIAAIVVIWTQLRAERRGGTPAGGAVALPTAPLGMDGVAAKGDSLAPVGIIEFSDFQCPFCGRFARESLPELERDYIRTGKVRLVFRHLPLDRHPAALPAAMAAECAGQQGKFWELHDKLFAADEATLTEDHVTRLSGSLGLSASEFDACIQNDARGRVSQDLELARQLGVSSTPIFFVGKILPSGQLQVSAAVPGALPISEFRRTLDSILEPGWFDNRLRPLFGRRE